MHKAELATIQAERALQERIAEEIIKLVEV